MKSFLKPNRFKIVFSLIFVLLTMACLGIAEYAKGNIISEIANWAFVVLYFPGAAFTGLLGLSPIFKKCLPHNDGTITEICYWDTPQYVFVLGLVIFLIYVYILSAIVYKLKNKKL